MPSVATEKKSVSSILAGLLGTGTVLPKSSTSAKSASGVEGRSRSNDTSMDDFRVSSGIFPKSYPNRHVIHNFLARGGGSASGVKSSRYGSSLDDSARKPASAKSTKQEVVGTDFRCVSSFFF